MEWDQRTLDLVTSQRVRIAHDILVTGTGQIPPWTTWYSRPPNLTRDTTPGYRLVTFGVVNASGETIRHLRPQELLKASCSLY
eukprot:6826481-Heterocapsa_arctica.AAC.1